MVGYSNSFKTLTCRPKAHAICISKTWIRTSTKQKNKHFQCFNYANERIAFEEMYNFFELFPHKDFNGGKREKKKEERNEEENFLINIYIFFSQ